MLKNPFVAGLQEGRSLVGFWRVAACETDLSLLWQGLTQLAVGAEKTCAVGAPAGGPV